METAWWRCDRHARGSQGEVRWSVWVQDTYGPLVQDLAARQAARVSSQVDAAKARAADLATALAKVISPRTISSYLSILSQNICN